VEGSCEYSDEPSGSGAMELVSGNVFYKNRSRIRMTDSRDQMSPSVV
jgi:hypothetical protein